MEFRYSGACRAICGSIMWARTLIQVDWLRVSTRLHWEARKCPSLGTTDLFGRAGTPGAPLFGFLCLDFYFSTLENSPVVAFTATRSLAVSRSMPSYTGPVNSFS